MPDIEPILSPSEQPETKAETKTETETQEVTHGDPILTGNQAWYEGMSQELIQSPEFSNFKDRTHAELFSAYKHSREMLGKDRIEQPTKDSAPEVWDEFWKAAGKPEKADSYVMPEISDELAESWNEEDRKSLVSAAHKANLNQEQFARIMKEFAGFAERDRQARVEHQQAMQTNQNQVVEELRAEWKQNYGLRINEATRALDALLAESGDSEAFRSLKLDTGQSLLANKHFIKSLAGFYQTYIAEPGALPGVITGTATDVVDANKQLERLHAHPAYMNENHPEHNKIRQQIHEVYLSRHGATVQ